MNWGSYVIIRACASSEANLQHAIAGFPVSHAVHLQPSRTDTREVDVV